MIANNKLIRKMNRFNNFFRKVTMNKLINKGTNIGYACLLIKDNKSKYNTLRLNNLSEDNFIRVVKNNLEVLKKTLLYNVKNDICLFRISSDLIPLATHKNNPYNYLEYFKNELDEIRNIISKNNIRVTMHPGQYTVLNSLREDVVENAIKELEYHSDLLDILSDNEPVIVLHIGGVYGNKALSIERFIKNYDRLNSKAKSMLVIENDDKSYNIADVLYISSKTSIPVIFDNLHHEINPPAEFKRINEWIALANATFKQKNLRQKIHYSQQAKYKKIGSHSKTIFYKEFVEFYESLENKNIDIMLEVKDKNLSAKKTNLILFNRWSKSELQKEWARYKYYVLSKSPNIYKDIREYLKEDRVDACIFYDFIERSINLDSEIKYEINTLEHIWGYFSKNCTDKEKKKYLKLLDEPNTKNISSLKKFLFKLSEKYDNDYLLNSLYFYI